MKETTITITRSDLVKAFQDWIDSAAKTPDGSYFLDNTVSPAEECADSMFQSLTSA